MKWRSVILFLVPAAKSSTIGVVRTDHIQSPLPPNRTGGFSAYGSPLIRFLWWERNGTLFDGLLAVGGIVMDPILQAYGDGDHADVILHHDQPL